MATNDNILSSVEGISIHGATSMTVANYEKGNRGAGVNIDNLDAMSPMLFLGAVPLVLKTPTMYDNNPAMAKFIKCALELWGNQITGIDVSYTVNTEETSKFTDGQTIKNPTTTTRDPMSPSYTFTEVAGNMIWEGMRKWIWDFRHPDTGKAFTGMTDPDPHVISAWSAVTQYIMFDGTQEPDRIIAAPIVYNMFPLGTDKLGLERIQGQSSIKERTIEFAAYYIDNAQTRLIGVSNAKNMNLQTLNWNNVRPKMVSPEELIKEAGMANEIKTLRATVTV